MRRLRLKRSSSGKPAFGFSGWELCAERRTEPGPDGRADQPEGVRWRVRGQRKPYSNTYVTESQYAMIRAGTGRGYDVNPTTDERLDRRRGIKTKKTQNQKAHQNSLTSVSTRTEHSDHADISLFGTVVAHEHEDERRDPLASGFRCRSRTSVTRGLLPVLPRPTRGGPRAFGRTLNGNGIVDIHECYFTLTLQDFNPRRR